MVTDETKLEVLRRRNIKNEMHCNALERRILQLEQGLVPPPVQAPLPAMWWGKNVHDLSGDHARNILAMLLREGRVKGIPQTVYRRNVPGYFVDEIPFDYGY